MYDQIEKRALRLLKLFGEPIPRVDDRFDRLHYDDGSVLLQVRFDINEDHDWEAHVRRLVVEFRFGRLPADMKVAPGLSPVLDTTYGNAGRFSAMTDLPLEAVRRVSDHMDRALVLFDLALV